MNGNDRVPTDGSDLPSPEPLADASVPRGDFSARPVPSAQPIAFPIPGPGVASINGLPMHRTPWGFVPLVAVAPLPTNGIAVAGMVLGIIGAGTSFSLALTWWLAAPMAVLGLVFGIVGLRRAPSRGNRGRGQAITAIVLCGIPVAFFVLLMAGLAGTTD